MRLDVGGFHALPKECQAEALAWVAEVLGPNAPTTDIERMDDGQWRLAVLVVGFDGQVVLNKRGDDAVTASFFTTIEPPRCVQEAMS